MTTYNTRNPLGSVAPKDLFDNSQNLDQFANNRTLETYPDRFGAERKTLHGIERQADRQHNAIERRADSQYQAIDQRAAGQHQHVQNAADAQLQANQLAFLRFLESSGYASLGEYAAGIVLESHNQGFMRGGVFYSPKSTAALPYRTTGDWGADERFFVVRGDDALRQELAAPSGGAAIVGYDPSGAYPAGSTAAGVRQARQSSFSVDQLYSLTPRPQMRPSAAFLNAVMSGQVKVAIVGDSISAGADLIYSNSYAQNLTQMLQQRFPWIQWSVVNYAISGRGAVNLADPGYTAPSHFQFPFNASGVDSQHWPTGSVDGKSWRDHVRDAAPDMIIYAFGMNDGVDVNAFSGNFDAFYSYAQTWSKKPWFTLVSCFLPTNQIIGGNPGWKEAQKGQQEIADWVRHSAIFKGFGLIDANATYRLLRDGVRREYAPYEHEANWRYWGDAGKWGNIDHLPTVNGPLATFLSSGLLVRKVAARDVDCSADFRFDSLDTVARWNYRSRSDNQDLAGYEVQLSLGGSLDLYYGSSLVLTVHVAPIPLGTYASIRVKATGSLHEVWVNGVRAMAATHGAGYFSGSIMVGIASGLGAVANPLLTYAPEAEVAPQYFDEAYLIGAVPYGDIDTNPDSAGGNAINHPSTLGSYAFYVSAVSQWISELGSAVFGRPITVSAGRKNSAISAAILPAVSEIPDMDCRVTVPETGWATVSISFGYKNPNPQTGVLQLILNGNVYDAWYLPSTAMTLQAGEPDADPRNFSATIPVLLDPGTYVFGLRWGGPINGASITSGGNGASRSLAVQVMPS